jgi:hypothetical protein
VALAPCSPLADSPPPAGVAVETYTETHLAIAALVSDRSARRPTRRKTSTELVLVQQTAC